jgi:hypothetical protein
VTAAARLLLVAGAALFVGACGSVQAAAAKDPMKCERDPNCKDHSRSFDCSTQCTDDPACMQRCEEVQEQTGTGSPR